MQLVEVGHQQVCAQPFSELRVGGSVAHGEEMAGNGFLEFLLE